MDCMGIGRPETVYILTASDLEEAFRRIASQMEAEKEKE